MRIDLHVLSPNDEMSRRNGSAVLTVAKQLQAAAQESGNESWLGGASHTKNNLDGITNILKKSRFTISGKIPKLLNGAVKYALGRSLETPNLIRTEVSPTDVYCHNQPWLISQLKNQYPEAKLHLYVHNVILQGAPPRMIRSIIDKCDSVICVSNYIRKDLISRSKIQHLNEHTPIYACLNGVDAEVYRDSDSPQHRYSYDVVYVGRIVPGKGVHILAEALQTIATDRPVKALIVGGHSFLPGNETAYVRNLKKALNSGNLETAFTGPIPPSDVPAYLNSARVHVAPSIWPEACPLVVLEGLASRACVVATATGGTPEIAEQTKLQLIPAGDSSSLTQAIARYLANEHLRTADAHTQTAWAQKRTWLSVYNTIATYSNEK